MRVPSDGTDMKVRPVAFSRAAGSVGVLNRGYCLSCSIGPQTISALRIGIA